MSTILVDDHAGGVRVLTLAKPPANAIDERVLADLEAALDAARADDVVRAVVLTGHGGFFSGGFDFAAPRRDPEAERAVYLLYRGSHLKLLGFPKPTVAMVNGHAIAGGLVLALACDQRFGVDGAYRVGLNEVAVGAAFPRVAAEVVRLRLAQAAASELVLGARLYAARAAVRLGVVDELLPAEGFTATVLERAARLGAFPREAYAHAKTWLLGDTLARIEAETPAEAIGTLGVWNAPESRAARRAQREKLGVRR